MNALDVLKRGNLTVIKSLEGLPDEDWHVGGVCGVWSIKDIVAHLASSELLHTEALDTFFGSELGPNFTERYRIGAEWNDIQVEKRRALSVEQVLAEYNGHHERVVAMLERLPPETVRRAGTMPWYGPDYSLDDLIAYSSYGHKREHCAQISVYRDRAKV